MKNLLTLFLVFICLNGQGLASDQFFIGGEVGHVGVRDNQPISNAIGYGVDIGVPANSYLDLMFRVHYSFHDGVTGLGTKLVQASVAAVGNLVDYGDFRVSVEGGPGFYFFDTGVGKEEKFGVHAGLNGDVILQDRFLLGLSGRLHWILDQNLVAFNQVAVMMRAGFLLE